MADADFSTTIETLLEKYQDTPLRARWEEAIAFGRGADAIAYWVRDTEEIINIAWLNAEGIRDINFLPALNNATFGFLPLRNISYVEVAEVTDIARHYGYGVSGDYLVMAFSFAQRPRLAWAASTENEKIALQAFSNHLRSLLIQ